MPQSQPINSSQTDGLSSQFQRRWESTYHWRSMCSMLLGTPGLRAAWPMSSVNYALAECIDISGQANHLQTAAALGNVTYGRDPLGIAPIALFAGGANQYIYKLDGGVANWADIAIAGGDVQIIATQRGLTLGGWFYWAALPGAAQGLIFKDDGGANRQYQLVLNAANTIGFTVWAGPVAVASATTINAGWNHCVGVYDQASQDLSVVLNGVVTTNAGAAPAVLADTGAPFTVGADGGGGSLFTGYGSDCFLCAASLSLGFVKAGFHYTKAAFGVK